MSQYESKARPLWQRIPLYLQIAIGNPKPDNVQAIKNLAIPCNLILKALKALATPLILLAVLHSFMTATIPGRSGGRLAIFLLTNTLVAIFIGLLVANVLQPGKWGSFGDTALST